MSKRPVSIRSTPSSAPLEAMVTTQQSHIDDLVVTNRTLEHTINKLQEAVKAEEARSKDAVQKLHQQWRVERDEWRDGCDSLQAAHRIAHLRTAVDLDKERTAVMKEREENRKERLARMQRDFRLQLFQMREAELEDKVAQLEDQLREALETIEEERQAATERNGDQIKELKSKLALTTEELENALEEKNQVEKTLSGLRSDHAALKASSTSDATALERANLHVDGLKTSHAELKSSYDELQRKNTELSRQLEKWRNLENREGAEMEAVRKRKMELEVRVKELEERLDEREGTAEVTEEKLKKRLEKYRAALAERDEAIAEIEETANRNEAEAQEAKAQLARESKRIQELEALLEQGRARKASSESKPSEEEVEEVVAPSPAPSSSPTQAPKPKSRPKPKPTNRGSKSHPDAPEIVITQDEDVVELAEAPPKAKARGKGRVADDRVQTAPKKGKPKAKEGSPGEQPKPRSRRGAPQPMNTEDAEEVQVVEPPPAPDRKGKRKADVIEDVGEDAGRVKKRSRKKGSAREEEEAEKSVEEVEASKPQPDRTKSKPPGRPKSKPKEPVIEEEKGSDEEVTGPAKKKKRKINLFPPAQPASFEWGQFSQGDGGLNIPTDLSPVKDNDAVPPRSTSTLGSRFGSVLGVFGARR